MNNHRYTAAIYESNIEASEAMTIRIADLCYNGKS